MLVTTCLQVDRMVTITDLAMDLAHRIVDRDRMVNITDLQVMDLAHRIVDRDRMVTITDLQVDRIILQDQVDRMITMV